MILLILYYCQRGNLALSNEDHYNKDIKLPYPLRALDGRDFWDFFFFIFLFFSAAAPGCRPIKLFSSCKP